MCELGDVLLRKISDNLGAEWEKLASFLGFKQPKIEQFMMEGNLRGIENAIFNMLVSWRERQPVKTTNFRKELRDALIKCARSDLAESILEDSPRVQLDHIYASLCSKLETKPELFEEAVSVFYKSYVSMTTDSQVVLSLSAFGQGVNGVKTLAVADNLKAKEGKTATTRWKLLKKCQQRETDAEDDQFISATSIACSTSDEFAVVDAGVKFFARTVEVEKIHKPRVYGFKEDGTFRFSLDQSTLQDQGIVYASDLAVTKQGNFARVNGTKQGEIFDYAGNHVISFNITQSGSDSKYADRARCIASNSNGDLFIGDFRLELITVHNGDDFSLLREIPITIMPSHIAVDSRDHFCIVHENYRVDRCKVVGYDDSGDEVFTIIPKIGGKVARPLGVVYDTDDTLLLGVYDFTRERGGHVHLYSKTGEFLKCVLKGTDKPNGMTLQNRTLAIADGQSILFYQKETPEQK